MAAPESPIASATAILQRPMSIGVEFAHPFSIRQGMILPPVQKNSGSSASCGAAGASGGALEGRPDCVIPDG